jgi:hypothetical protein
MGPPPAATTAAAADESKLPLPKGWTRTFSKSKQRYYYSHADTKHTVRGLCFASGLEVYLDVAP